MREAIFSSCDSSSSTVSTYRPGTVSSLRRSPRPTKSAARSRHAVVLEMWDFQSKAVGMSDRASGRGIVEHRQECGFRRIWDRSQLRSAISARRFRDARSLSAVVLRARGRRFRSVNCDQS